MINIRYGIFETNSSMTHSLICCEEDEYKQLLAGEMYIYENELYSKAETIDKIMEDVVYDPEYYKTFFEQNYDMSFNSNFTFSRNFFEALNKDCFNSFIEKMDYGVAWESYTENEYLETFDTTYTTKKGETVHILGRYGQEY